MKVISMRGQKVDMGKLIAANSHKVALGNAGLNARGDKVGANGTVIATREQITMTEYNVSRKDAVRQVGLSDIGTEVLTPVEAVAKARKEAKAANEIASSQSKRKISD